MNVKRRRALESFSNAPAMLGAALRRFPRKMWLYKKSSDQQCIHDTVLHLADSEVIEYVSCRRLIAEPGSSTLEIDLVVWSQGLGYFYQDIKGAMDVIRILRRVTYRLLKALPEAAWENTAELPIHGRLSLGEWLEIRENLYPEHIQRMERIYSGWLESTAAGIPATSVRKTPPIESFTAWNGYEPQGWRVEQLWKKESRSDRVPGKKHNSVKCQRD